MSILDSVRDKFGNPREGTDKTDKRPSVSSVSSHPGETENYGDPSVSSVSAHPGEIQNYGQADEALLDRVRAMAARWKFSDEETKQELARAVADPETELRWLDHDERLCRALYGAKMQP